MTTHYQRNVDFMQRIIGAKRAAGIQCEDLPKVPTPMPLMQRLLRARLILEETLELINDGLGLNVSVGNDRPIDVNDIILLESHQGDLVELADGVADVSVVTIGTAIQCGLPVDDLLELVDANNLDKFQPGFSIRADGKLLKPPGHQPPDIVGLLARDL